MPYQTEDYNPPALPDFNQIRTFEDVRGAVGRILEYLHQLNGRHIQYFQHLRENLNQSATTQGPDLAATTTISPTQFMHVLTGTATITTILPPKDYAGQLMLFARDGFYLATGGNLSLFSSPNYIQPNAHILLTYVPSKQLWYADSCRLQNSTSSLAIGGRKVVTE